MEKYNQFIHHTKDKTITKQNAEQDAVIIGGDVGTPWSITFIFFLGLCCNSTPLAGNNSGLEINQD